MALFGRLPGDAAVPSLPTMAQVVPRNADDQGAIVDAWVADELRTTLATLAEVLDTSGAAGPGTFTPVPADEIEEHTWVQASVDGRWVDMDPSMPAQQIGEAMTVASRTLDAIPDERWHRIEFAVIGERLVNGTLETQELLSVDGPAEDFAGSPIVIANIGAGSVPALAAGFEQVLGLQTVHPVIAVGSHENAGVGMIFKEPDDDDGGGLGGGFFDTGDAADETTAQWIELRIMRPGALPVTTRRLVFDRIGREARANGTIEAADIPPVRAVDLDGDGTTALGPEHWVASLNVATGLPSLRSRIADQGDTASGRAAIVPFAHHLLNGLGAPQVAATFGVRPFVDAPNVTAVISRLDDASGDGVTLRTDLDIWHRSSGAAAVSGVDLTVDPTMLPGVLAHVNERLMFGAADPDHGAERPSVGALFAAAKEQGIPIGLLTSDSTPGLPLEPEAQGRLDDAMEAGLRVVAPLSAVTIGGEERSGWWLFDPASGRVNDQMDNGLGTMTVEQQIVGGIILIVAGLTIDHVITLTYSEIEGSLWDHVIKTLNEKL